MQIVLKAKLAFLTTLIIAFSLAYFASSWRYAGIIELKNGIIDKLENASRIKEESNKIYQDNKSIGMLNHNQKKLIYKEIKAYPNTKITIFKYEGKEMEQFVNQLKEIFQQAKWQVAISTYLEDNYIPSGIRLQVPNIHNYGDEMESLEKGLCLAGIDLSFKENKKYKTDHLSIVVGYRPN